MKVGVAIQARMSSKRMPGKVLRPICGKPMIEYVLESVARGGADETIVATSDHSSDEPIADYCARRGVDCFRGSLEDVASRFESILENTDWAAFVRVSADSPLLDPTLVQWATAAIRRRECEIATNIFPRTFPRGQSIEAIRREAFLRALPWMTDPADREQVTPVFYRQANRFFMVNLQSPREYGDCHLTVDGPEDFDSIERAIEQLHGEPWRRRLDEIVAVYRQQRHRARKLPEVA